MAILEIRPCKHGRGVIALEVIYRGEGVLHFGGPVLTREDLPRPLFPENDCYLQIGRNTFLGPSGDIDDFVNHSCDPNCFVVLEPDHGAKLVALKDIQPGEAILFDYSTTMYDAPCQMACCCGSPLCRGMVTDFLCLPLPLQARYASVGMVAPYIPTKYRMALPA